MRFYSSENCARFITKGETISIQHRMLEVLILYFQSDVNPWESICSMFSKNPLLNNRCIASIVTRNQRDNEIMRSTQFDLLHYINNVNPKRIMVAELFESISFDNNAAITFTVSR